jgi:hypothetical protein
MGCQRVSAALLEKLVHPDQGEDDDGGHQYLPCRPSNSRHPSHERMITRV